MTLMVAAVLAQASTTWNLRAIDILITTLLTVLVGLSAWALKRVLEYGERFEEVGKSLLRISQQIWGVDGKNGLASESREFSRAARRIEHAISRLSWRVTRLEERAGLPSGEHERYRSDDDDAEDDRRG
jgi:hypothetical protein